MSTLMAVLLNNASSITIFYSFFKKNITALNYSNCFLVDSSRFVIKRGDLNDSENGH